MKRSKLPLFRSSSSKKKKKKKRQREERIATAAAHPQRPREASATANAAPSGEQRAEEGSDGRDDGRVGDRLAASDGRRRIWSKVKRRAVSSKVTVAQAKLIGALLRRHRRIVVDGGGGGGGPGRKAEKKAEGDPRSAKVEAEAEAGEKRRPDIGRIGAEEFIEPTPEAAAIPEEQSPPAPPASDAAVSDAAEGREPTDTVAGPEAGRTAIALRRRTAPPGGGTPPAETNAAEYADVAAMEQGSNARGLATSAALMAAGVKPKNPLLSRKPFSGEKTDGAVTKVGLTALDGTALAAVGTSIATLFLTTGVVVSVASYLTIAFGPLAAYQKRKLKGLGGSRGQHNALREKVSDLTVENDKLKENVNRLESTVSKVEEVEKELAKLANTDNVDRLVRIVNEQGDVLKEMKEALEAQVIHNVMDVVMRSDRNRDFMIGPHELDEVVMRMKNLEGVDFREDKFRAMLGKKKRYKLGSLMNLLRQLLDDDVPEEENVFVIKPEDLTSG